MKKIIFFLFLIPAYILAQPRGVFHIDNLPPEGILLDKGWKWHAGDNPEWAKPEFDDAGWEEIDPSKDVVQLTDISTDQPLWLRIRLGHQAAKAYALSISQSGASEIYLNGRLIQKIGQIYPGKQGIHAYNPLDDHLILKLDSLDNTLAIRYYFQPGLNLDPIYSVRCYLFSARIFDSTYMLSSPNSNFWNGFNIGFALILFFVHGVLFLYYPPLRANLWFSVWAFTGTVFSYFLFQLEINPYLERNAKYVFFSLLTSQLGEFCLLWCLYVLLENKRRVYILLFVAVDLANISIYYLWGYATRDFLWFVTTIFKTILTVSMAIEANRQRSRSGMPVLYGTLAYFLFWTLFITSYELSWSSISKDILFHLATLSFPVTISALLGYKFRQVNQSMLRNLEQVNQLSAEKQHLLSTQNETLERQVTERTAALKASQSQLIQSEKLASLGELTAGIAHEIQNPLNFVNNFSELNRELIAEMEEEIEKGNLSEVKLIATDLAANEEKINHHGQRASAIVKSMLEHSRTSSGTKEPTDLNALADEYLRLAYHGFRAKDSNFNADYKLIADPDLPKVDVIPQDMERVLLNLISNAFYAVNEKTMQGIEDYLPTVIVNTRYLENTIEISVQDNGNGIPEAIKDKIFQPFFTTKPTGQGTGLGLSLAYDMVVKGHGGRLEVESEEGKGTTFVISLPVNG